MVKISWEKWGVIFTVAMLAFMVWQEHRAAPIPIPIPEMPSLIIEEWREREERGLV